MGCSNGSCSTSSHYVPTSAIAPSGKGCPCNAAPEEAVAPSGVVMGLPATYTPKRDASPQRACFAKGYRAPKHPPQASFAPHVGIVQEGGTAFRPTPHVPSDKPAVMRSDVSVPRTSIGDGGEMATRATYRAPTTTIRQAIPGKGMVAIPAPAPQLPPPAMQKPTDLGGGEAQSPVPFLPSVPMIGLAQAPNPFAPYCGAGGELDPTAALCAAAGDAGLSDYCRQQLLAFLGSKSSQTLGSWIAAQELCDQAALRRAVGLAEASMAAKASAGLYRASGGTYSRHAFVVAGMPHGGTVYVDNQPVMGRWLDAGLTRWEVPLPDANPHRVRVRSASGDTRDSSVLNGSTLVFDQMNTASAEGTTPEYNYPVHFVSTPAPQLDKPGFGNPFGADGYAWKQDRVRKPSPFAPQSNATMDWRNPSGALPNYYRASGLVTDAGGRYTAEEIQAFNQSQAGADLYRQELAQAAAASPPASPPVDYGAIIGGIGQAVGASLAGIGAIVNTQQQNRLRELEIEYANNARGAQLALQRSAMEMQAEIARLSAQGTPAAQATVTALQQQVADANARLAAAAAADQGMGTGTAVALGVGAVALLGIGAYVVMGKRR